MKARICICCGEPMVKRGNARSRNPNVCASCSGLADGMEESNVAALAGPSPNQASGPESAKAVVQQSEEKRVRIRR